ncbi:hypothetical protein EON83_17995 [bacterium]|nr:MAG: hypothetical protein EON83_17995 [bacterium]
MSFSSRLALLLSPMLSVYGAHAQTSPMSVALLPPTPASYKAIGQQTDENLRAHVLSQWFPRAIAKDLGGGFDQNFSENWANTSKGERSVVYQARLTWLASQAALRYAPEAERWKQYASHGASFLRDHMWDSQYGGFFWQLQSGKPAREGEKHAYGIAFAIYALAAHFQATGDARSLDMAQKAFRWLESHAHDPKNGGYYEALTQQGKPIIIAPSTEQPTDVIGTRYGYKSMNTHIHLLEAFAALSEEWKDKTLRSRLSEVFHLVRDTVVVAPPGAMHLYFRPDWKAIPGHDSYGHDIETAYLLVEASTVLGHPDDEQTWNVARALVDHTLEVALDSQNGGIYNEGDTFGAISDADKVWWVQAEALNALLLMHHKYGRAMPRYWEAFQRQWAFIQGRQIDRKNGGWFGHVSKEGQATPGASKSSGWTEGYHQGRALLNVSKLLKEMST